jgi:hypothetical protein
MIGELKPAVEKPQRSFAKGFLKFFKYEFLALSCRLSLA